jgi:aldehyde:ferredoxin oxidoreductase
MTWIWHHPLHRRENPALREPNRKTHPQRNRSEGDGTMATPGYAGKILRVNLTTKQISSIDTSRYEEYGGGYGIGTAIFWDLCVAPGGWDLQDAFDPRNIVTLMTGPLAGTGLPFTGRTSVSGLSPQPWPICWFSRSNFGGSFSSMLKFAGWDGVVVEGKAEEPVYINIIDDKVTIEDAKPLWGLSTWETQDEIHRMLSIKTPIRYSAEWQKLGSGYTTARPSIVTIGPAGENKTRIGSLVHGGGSGAGQGGFGSVLGSKNMKAIAVIGTGSVKVADPRAVRDAREWYSTTWPGRPSNTGSASCTGCNRACRRRDGIFGKDSDGCMESVWYNLPSPPYKRTSLNDRFKATDIAQRYGINAFDICFGGPMAFPSPKHHPIQPAVPASTGAGWYFKQLYDIGIIGPGKKIDTAPLPMEMYDQVEFAEAYVVAICKRVGIGKLLAEGVARFAESVGRISDMDTILRCPAWGFVDHWTMPTVEWAYGNLMDSRDINNHDMSLGPSKTMPCEDFVKMVASGVLPYNDDHFMFDYSWQGDQAYKTGIYSDHKAKFVSWRQHYAMFYKESILLCDWAFSNLSNPGGPNGRGATPQAEPVFLKAVTGKDFKFTDGIEAGRKIWNIKRAIFSLQGRHRDMEKFAGFMCRPGASNAALGGTLPVYDGSKWDWQGLTDLYLDEQGVEQWKTAFYKFEGWDPKSGYPNRKTLQGLGLNHVADVLQSQDKLGSG